MRAVVDGKLDGKWGPEEFDCFGETNVPFGCHDKSPRGLWLCTHHYTDRNGTLLHLAVSNKRTETPIRPASITAIWDDNGNYDNGKDPGASQGTPGWLTWDQAYEDFLMNTEYSPYSEEEVQSVALAAVELLHSLEKT